MLGGREIFHPLAPGSPIYVICLPSYKEKVLQGSIHGKLYVKQSRQAELKVAGIPNVTHQDIMTPPTHNCLTPIFFPHSIFQISKDHYD